MSIYHSRRSTTTLSSPTGAATGEGELAHSVGREPVSPSLDSRCCGGRTWWAHLEFTRINITPTILRKQVEENPDVPEIESFSRQYR
jgi:hypothetical protein